MHATSLKKYKMHVTKSWMALVKLQLTRCGGGDSFVDQSENIDENIEYWSNIDCEYLRNDFQSAIFTWVQN